MHDRFLDGVRVVDFTRVLAGPYCTRLLAAMGAEVIKIEQPKVGDDSRYYPYPLGEKMTGYYLQLNSGKKSISVDLKDERGLKIIRELIKVSDVVVENFRPGTLEKNGLGYKQLREINERIVMCSISGFGQNGPYSQRGAHGILAEALSGAMHITGLPGLPPPIFGVPVSDVATGTHAFGALCGALFYREKTGKGQYIDISLLDCIFDMHEFAIQQFILSQGKVHLGCYGSSFPSVVPYGVFKCRDRYLIIAAANDANFRRLAKAMGRLDLPDNPKFLSNNDRVKNQKDLLAEIQKWLDGFNSVEPALEILHREGVPCAPVNDIAGAVNDPQLRAREMLVPVENPSGGTVRMQNVPYRLSEAVARVGEHAASLGEHTQEILHTVLNYDESEIRILKEDGVIYWE